MRCAALLLTLAISLAACGGGGNNPPPNPYPGRLQPTNTGWTTYGTGTGIIASLGNPFTFVAQPKSLNYVYTAPTGPASSLTIRLNYSIRGDAVFGTIDGGVPSIRLFLWQSNDQGGETYRWWCAQGNALVVGDNQTLTCTVTPGVLWTDVNGQPASSNVVAFANAANNLFAIGFTFGGNFYGHGVWTTSGSANFTVNSFTVQ